MEKPTLIEAAEYPVTALLEAGAKGRGRREIAARWGLGRAEGWAWGTLVDKVDTVSI